MTVGALGASRAKKPKGSSLERISPKVRAEIINRVRDGVPGGVAAVSCGVGRRTFVRWLEFGRAPDAREPYRSFAADCDQAFAEWQVGKVREISAASSKDWRAGIELLKRRAPDEYADPDRAGTTVNIENVIELRSQTVSEVLTAARGALEPEAFERLVDSLAPQVVEGEAVELGELGESASA